MHLNHHEIINVCSKFGIDTVFSYDKVSMGIANHNWIINANNKKYILRCVFEEKTEDKLYKEFYFLNFLSNNEFLYVIPRPLSSLDNKKHILYNDKLFWIYPFIEGEIVKGPFTNSQLGEVAIMMSNLHKIISNSNIKDEMKNDDFNPKIIFDEVESQRKEAIKDNSEFSSFYLEYADKLLILLKNTVYPSLPKYPLHRDINPENVIFIKDKLIGVIDFDNVSIFDEPLVKDIVNLFLYSCYKEDDKTILDMGLAERFICAYSKIRSLSNEEIENIPILAVFGILEDVNYEYWLYLNEPQRTSLEKIERRYKTGLWYYENSKLIIELLKKGLAK